MVTVAVDAGGADLGPREVAAGAARAAANGIRVLLFGPATEIGAVPAGVEVVDAPVSIAKQAREELEEGMIEVAPRRPPTRRCGGVRGRNRRC